MERSAKRNISPRAYFFFTLGLCALLVVLVVLLALGYGGNDVHSFSEPVMSLASGWTIADRDGNAHPILLPETIDYGVDGRYTLSCVLPEMEGPLSSPAFRFYSNYVDVTVALDGETLYVFPPSSAAFSGATGNTYHFVRLPADYAGKTVSVQLRCQLGDGVTYLLAPPLLGSKATMLNRDVMRSLPAFTLAGCMSILAVGLGALYFVFRKQLRLNNATLYTALFALLFAAYIYLETTFAQLLMPNGYLLCFTTLMLLALLPIPLIGVFLNAVSARFQPLMRGLMLLCAGNLLVQLALNFANILSVRTMLPATHMVMLTTILIASLCLFFSDRAEKPGARRALLSAVPMIVGGLADIILLNLNRPSMNNSFWFALGVTVFIVTQLCGFIFNYFTLYRTALESKLLANMAYHDALSGIDNRNAYERKLKELGGQTPSPNLCCIVADINDLKVINDALGHRAGDAAIAEVGAVLRDCMPKNASFFRTGGDEFVILLEGYDEQRTKRLAETLSSETEARGARHSVPVCLAIGVGQYAASDGNIVDFIRRVDTRMYECKRRQKSACRAVRPGTER